MGPLSLVRLMGLFGQVPPAAPLSNPVLEEGREECLSPQWSHAVVPRSMDLQLPDGADNLMLPSLLNSMSKSLYSPFSSVIS